MPWAIVSAAFALRIATEGSTCIADFASAIAASNRTADVAADTFTTGAAAVRKGAANITPTARLQAITRDRIDLCIQPLFRKAATRVKGDRTSCAIAR